MSEFDESVLQRESFLKQAIVLPQVDSTNEFAKTLLRTNDVELPVACIAVKQTQGRGQQAKKWWSGPGSLTFTLAMQDPQLPAAGLLAIGSAIAVCECVTHFHHELSPRIKWPNDVLLDGKKLCGILIEVLSLPEPVVLIGIGVNTNCGLQSAPEELRHTATSLVSVTGVEIPQQQFLLRLLQSLNKWILQDNSKGIIDTFMSISQFEKGETIYVESSRYTSVEGQFDGIGTHGQLILRVDGESFAIESGSIIAPR